MKIVSIVCSLIAVGAIFLLRNLGNDSLGYPDADRILMDGVFIRDVLVDMPFSAPYQYAVNYFGQYPALSIGYRPPFFPFIEALFNLVFGVNTWSSRLALFAFAAVGIVAWFAIVRRIFGLLVATLSILVWLSTPFFAQWGWYTMGEIPVVSMALVTAYFFYRYMETGATRDILLTAVFFGLAAWTKQTAVYVALWLILYLLTTGRTLEILRQKAVWAAAGIAIIILIPLAVMTLAFGEQNLYQSIGEMPSYRSSRFSLENWTVHLRNLVTLHITLPLTALSVCGAAFAIYYRDKKSLFFATSIVAVYVFFSLLVGKSPRYPIFWIPPIAVFAVLPVYYLREFKKLQIGFSSIVVAVFAYQAYLIFDREPAYAGGYKKTAEFVIENTKSPMVLFDGYNNGYFTYFARAQDPSRSLYVLRGDKLLTTSSISAKHWLTVHAKDASDIDEILDKYAISLIVVESKDYTGIDIHKIFRKHLEGPNFRLLREVPIVSNRNVSILPGSPPLGDQTLKIYEYLKAKKLTEDELVIDLPVVGKTLRVPLDKFRTRQ